MDLQEAKKMEIFKTLPAPRPAGPKTSNYRDNPLHKGDGILEMEKSEKRAAEHLTFKAESDAATAAEKAVAAAQPQVPARCPNVGCSQFGCNGQCQEVQTATANQEAEAAAKAEQAWSLHGISASYQTKS